ncbi:hypothetical protein NPIL_550311 [Nephila pilipes]|uniref:Uncharacterized protein n=1 Tax=Nephila pilipes TaxID=299642 RepID=A0A8X6QUK4_NEPPI|nr:hypothetical protein NPIL_550311 [Nephila pilipes]
MYRKKILYVPHKSGRFGRGGKRCVWGLVGESNRPETNRCSAIFFSSDRFFLGGPGAFRAISVLRTGAANELDASSDPKQIVGRVGRTAMKAANFTVLK